MNIFTEQIYRIPAQQKLSAPTERRNLKATFLFYKYSEILNILLSRIYIYCYSSNHKVESYLNIQTSQIGINFFNYCFAMYKFINLDSTVQTILASICIPLIILFVNCYTNTLLIKITIQFLYLRCLTTEFQNENCTCKIKNREIQLFLISVVLNFTRTTCNCVINNI